MHVDINSQHSWKTSDVCYSFHFVYCMQKTISGAPAGKENLALAQCCASLFKKKKIVPKTRKLQQVLF